MFTPVSKALVSSWASCAVKALSLFDLGVSWRPFFIKNNGNRDNCILIVLIWELATWINFIISPCSVLGVAAPSLFFRGGDMKYISFIPFLLIFVFSSSSHAGWKCNPSFSSSYSSDCSSAGVQDSPESFITAFVSAVRSANTSPNRTGYTAGSCTMNGNSNASCAYSWTSFGSHFDDSVGIVKEAAVCPGTVETRGPDAAAIKSGDKYYVAWSVSSVTADVCHNSCSYLASSASGSTCYLSPSSTVTGFCNYFVGLNTASPSCNAESGYKSPSVGDPLTPSSNPGDGGNGGTNPGGGNDGGNGNGGNGGDGDSGFDGELSFNSPGSLEGKSILDSEVNAAHYNSFVHGMESDLNESGFGKALNEFNQKIASSGSTAACPKATVFLLGSMITFDAHCALFDLVSPILSAVFLAAWSLLALRVFLSA